MSSEHNNASITLITAVLRKSNEKHRNSILQNYGCGVSFFRLSESGNVSKLRMQLVVQLSIDDIATASSNRIEHNVKQRC